MTNEQNKLMVDLKKNKSRLTRQQYCTVKGQILSGDTVGAAKGMKKLLSDRWKGCVGYAKQTEGTV